MSELVVVGFTDRDRAAQVLNAIRELDPAWTDRNDVVAVGKDRKGNVRTAEPGTLVTGRSMPWSTLWRGLLQGTGKSRLSAPVCDTVQANAVGLPERFLVAVDQRIQRGDSALVIWARTPVPPPMHAYLHESAGDIQWARLTPEQDALLVSVLDVLVPVEHERN